MLFAVRGRFANNYTFSVNPVDGSDAKEALGTVLNSAEIKDYGQPVVMVSVKALGASKKKIHISDAPAKERKGGGRKKKEATASAPASPPAQSRKR